MALATLIAAVAAAPAAAQTLSWTALLPAAPAGSNPSQAPECPAGEPECVDQVAQALATHVAELGCSHNAVFALAYQRITERIAEAVRDPQFFADPRYIAHFDAAFAGEYGRQWDAWAGAAGHVAPAWRTAFDVAAGDPVAKAALMAQIEREAQARAVAIATATAYPPGSGGAVARDAYCRSRTP